MTLYKSSEEQAICSTHKFPGPKQGAGAKQYIAIGLF